MVQVFAMVMEKVWDFVNAIAVLSIKFNEAHPILSKLIQGFLMLILAITLLLSPLAVGIGLWKGLLAAFSSLWTFISPLITGLAAISATVWIVAASVVALVAIFIYLWNTNEGFKNAVINSWNAIKETAISVWQGIIQIITPAFQAVVEFVKAKLDEMKGFWDENAAQITQALSNVWEGIKTIISAAITVITPIIKVGWEMIKMIIQSTWEAIKNVINGALEIIKGIIKVFSGIFTGDFSKMWEGIKQIFFGALELIWGWINLYFVSKLLGPLKTFGNTAKTFLQSVWALLKESLRTP